MGSMAKDKLADQVREIELNKKPKGARRISDDIREAGSNSYAKDNQIAIKKLKG